jgi:excisionase family DNA binding protein
MLEARRRGSDVAGEGSRFLMDVTATRVQVAREICPFLTAKQAAFYLGLSYSALRAMRAAGKGPRCRLHGRTWRYHVDDLESWSEAHAQGGLDG